MKISEADVKKRLDVYVSEVNAITRSHAQTMIDSGLVRVNGKSEGKNYKLRLNDEIEIDEEEIELLNAEPENIPLDIVYEDEHIIVVNKPSGMVVHPAPGNPSRSLVNALMYHCKGTLSQ